MIDDKSGIPRFGFRAYADALGDLRLQIATLLPGMSKMVTQSHRILKIRLLVAAQSA